MDIDYSVIIRTTGKAKEKYAGLLSSIAALLPQPKEVIVVLPNGYDLPEERLGWETFYSCPKGMVVQRMTGITKCKTKYALICDDDVRFESDFVQKLHEPIAAGLCGLSAGPLYSFLPPKGKGSMINIVMGTALPTVFHKDRYVSVLRTTGYSYNRNLQSEKKYYETQSVAWTCFYADIEKLRSTDFEAEQIWLDKNGYSALDDQTMFYKAWIRGIKTFVVTDAYYEHLDAKTSTRNNREPVMISAGFNRVVFWHRYIYTQEKTLLAKLWAHICFAYRRVWAWIWDIGCIIVKRDTLSDFRTKRNGYRDGYSYLKTDEYKALPPVR